MNDREIDENLSALWVNRKQLSSNIYISNDSVE